MSVVENRPRFLDTNKIAIQAVLHGLNNQNQELPEEALNMSSERALSIAKLTYGLFGKAGDSEEVGILVAEGSRVKLDKLFFELTEEYGVNNIKELYEVMGKYAQRWNEFSPETRRMLSSMSIDEVENSREIIYEEERKVTVNLAKTIAIMKDFSEGMTIGYMWGQQKAGGESAMVKATKEENVEEIRKSIGVKSLEGAEGFY